MTLAVGRPDFGLKSAARNSCHCHCPPSAPQAHERKPMRGQATTRRRQAARSHSADTKTGRASMLAPRLIGSCCRRPAAKGNSADAAAHFKKVVTDLPYFDSRARIFKLLLDFIGFFLVDPFLDRLGRRLDEVSRFLEPQRGDRPDVLDPVDLLLA